MPPKSEVQEVLGSVSTLLEVSSEQMMHLDPNPTALNLSGTTASPKVLLRLGRRGRWAHRKPEEKIQYDVIKKKKKGKKSSGTNHTQEPKTVLQPRPTTFAALRFALRKQFPCSALAEGLTVIFFFNTEMCLESQCISFPLGFRRQKAISD